jgi:hypothetical protein
MSDWAENDFALQSAGLEPLMGIRHLLKRYSLRHIWADQAVFQQVEQTS